jgi:hypothetical protein
MRAVGRSTLTFAVMVAVLIGYNSAGAADAKDLKGWGLDDPYHKLYKAKESERLKATVIKVLDVVPLPGMSPGVALEVREGSETIVVHLCPVGYAKPSEIGIKPGDKVTIRGCWAEARTCSWPPRSRRATPSSSKCGFPRTAPPSGR